MIYDLLLFFSSPSLTAPFEMVALTTQRINIMTYLIAITNNGKICDWLGQKFKFLCKLIGCETHEGAELTINEQLSFPLYRRESYT